MKFTLSWLKEHLETEASLDDILDTLNRIGLEVEGVENPADKLRPFVIVDVLEAEQHPDADKLRVCKVTDGAETYQIVCGAPNARAGMKAVLGKPGTHVPGADFTLKVGKIRGVDSYGMMCSARELEMGEDHDGILDLPSDAKTGTSYADYLELDDPVIDIAITPNRQDCLGVYGIARDLAAAGLGTLKTLTVPTVAGDSAVTAPSIAIDADAAADCPVFFGRRFTGVKNGESPAWLKRRLEAVGQKSISALVDITNYISIAFARPLHVYDAQKLSGGIMVRKAKAGETFLALNETDYEAAGGETVITDDASVLGFGGIIGGEASGCQMDTSEVILECAWFDPIDIANTGRKHQINTDARYRFERGVDTGFIADGFTLASQMILDLCGGTAGVPVIAGAVPSFNKTVTFRPDRVESLGGLAVEAERSKAILENLGFTVTGSDPFDVAVPSWRRDIEGEPDLVEEVLRIVGYDEIPSVPLPSRGGAHRLTPSQKRARAVRRALAANGLMECVTWSFMEQERASTFAPSNPRLVVDNPISSVLNYMRPSILPNLIEAAGRNKARAQDSIALMEVGPIYLGDGEKDQRLVASGIRAGLISDRHWQGGGKAVSVFDAKADAIAALVAAGAPVDNLQVFEEAPDYFHPYRRGTLRLGAKTVLAEFGELHPSTLEALDVDGPVVGFTVFLDAIPMGRKKGTSKGALQISNLQPVTRDYAFTMASDAAVAPLVRAIKGADKKHVTSVDVFDIYEGQGVADGEKSVAICVRLEPAETTFSDDQLEAISSKIVTAAEKSGNARLRQ